MVKNSSEYTKYINGVLRIININIKLASYIFLPLIIFAMEMHFPLSYVRFIGETAEIDQTSCSYLDSLALFLEKTNAKIEIGGHTDNVGTPAEKQKFSEARAKAVYDYLILKHKVPEVNLSYKGYGSTLPVATNRTAEGRAKNNRIEIKVHSISSTAKIKFVKGKVYISKSGISEPKEISESNTITLFDKISTDSTGRAQLQFIDGIYNIYPNTEVIVQDISVPQQKCNLYLRAGKLAISVSNESLLVTTTNCSLSTSQADFVLYSQPYYQDVISVWTDSLTISTKGYSKTIKNGYGLVCLYDNARWQESPLPESPSLDTTFQNYSFVYDEKNPNPFKLFYKKNTDINAHILVSKDSEFIEQIFETVSDLDSCVFGPFDVSHIYVSLNSVTIQGFESKPISYSFDVINAKKKFVLPKLEIKHQAIERNESGIVVLLKGTTDPECELLINNVKIKTEKDGSFAFRATLKTKAKSINLTAIDKKGNKNTVFIYLGIQNKLLLKLAGGATMLAGGGLNASKIGYITSGNLLYYFKNKIAIGPFGYFANIGCKTTDWEPDGSHYKTTVYSIGIRVNYYLNPFSKLPIYLSSEIGAGYWKSLYNNTVYNWAINPLVGASLGIDKNLGQRLSLWGECGLDYLRNKTKPNMGTQDINYIIPKGLIGFVIKI